MGDESLIKLKNEFEKLEDDPMTEIGCQVWLKDDDNYYEWEGMMQGPKDTPYKGAILYFTIYFEKDFPKSRPDFRFSYKNMYHLNVSPLNGHVCVNIINKWDPKTKMRDVIHAVWFILKKQNDNDPYPFGDDRVELYKKNRPQFEENVRIWVRNNALKTHRQKIE